MRLLRTNSVEIRISSPELHVSDQCFFNELHIMKRYVTTTYGLHGLHKYAQCGYLTTTYP